MKMVEDISNKTIVVLVVLTVIISILGTVVVLNEVKDFKPDTSTRAESVTKTSTEGYVRLNIEEPPASDSATGYVSLTIE